MAWQETDRISHIRIRIYGSVYGEAEHDRFDELMEGPLRWGVQPHQTMKVSR